MPQEWYYTKDGDRQGPITSKQLKQLAASGDLQPTDLVWTEGKDEWKPARIVKGLFQATIQPKTTKPPPIAGHSNQTAPAPTNVPTDQPGLLTRSMTKFNSLKTPQKFMVGGAVGMGAFFFLCMGLFVNTDGDGPSIFHTASYNQGYEIGFEFGRDMSRTLYPTGQFWSESTIMEVVRSACRLELRPEIRDDDDFYEGYRDGIRSGLGKRFADWQE